MNGISILCVFLLAVSSMAVVSASIAAATTTTEVSLDGKGFIRFDIHDQLFNPNVNRVKLKFRTTQPSGLLIYLSGINGDSLALQLVQGTLRLLLKKGDRTLNEALVGERLDDGRWHSVNILRIYRLLDIALDKKAEKTILIPGFSTELLLNRILFVGGKQKRPDSSHEAGLQLQHENFNGCLGAVFVDNKQPLIEMKKGNKNIVSFGVSSRGGCQRDVVFKPVHFANPQAAMKLRMPLTNKELRIKLQFRTFDSEGTIVFADGTRCHFILGVLGKKVYLELKQDEMLPAKVEVIGDVSNGLWHRMEATVTQTSVFLQVNNGAKVSAEFTSGYHCSTPSRLMIGGGATSKMKRGFVGCMNGIRVNEGLVNAFDPKEAQLIGTVLQKCNLKDKCFPLPCHNGGRCFQTWHSYGCDCSKTTFYGKHCNIPIYKETCDGYSALGLNQNSFCLLDSDGTGKLPPYTTACNITKTKKISTVVSHDRTSKRNITDGTNTVRGWHFHVINYDLPMEQIEALIKKSKTCRQLLKLDCYNAALSNNAMWWTRKGVVKSYWGGVPGDRGTGCKCGLTKSCAERDKLCNCDSLNNRWVEDSGYVIDKDMLPVSRLHFSGIKHGFAYITLGALECFGTADKQSHDEERPPNKILSKVCMSHTTKKYMTSNETELVWVTPVDQKSTGRGNIDNNQGMVDTTTGTIYSVTRRRNNMKSKTRSPSERPRAAQTTLAALNQRPTDNDVSKLTKKKKNVANESERVSVERQLSILEIVLIVFAALAISVLIIKFVLMKTVNFFKQRYQIKRLHTNDINRNIHTDTQGMVGRGATDEEGVVLKKIGPRKGGGSYWV